MPDRAVLVCAAMPSPLFQQLCSLQASRGLVALPLQQDAAEAEADIVHILVLWCRVFRHGGQLPYVIRARCSTAVSAASRVF